LRPNAAGDSTTWTSQYPNSTYHYDKVDEATSDDDSTYIRTNPTGTPSAKTDLYNIPDTAIPDDAVVDSITVFSRCRSEDGSFPGQCKETLKTGGTGYVGDTHSSIPTGYTLYSSSWALNPKTGLAWTKTDINALQIGVIGYNGQDPDYMVDYPIRCTQVYVEISYHVGAGPTGSVLRRLLVRIGL
jgi:hypothetical protein